MPLGHFIASCLAAKLSRLIRSLFVSFQNFVNLAIERGVAPLVFWLAAAETTAAFVMHVAQAVFGSL